MIDQALAACFTFVGLAGIYRKREWGPAVAAVASTGWAAINVAHAMYIYAFVELVYAAMSAATWRHWRHTRIDEESRRVALEYPTMPKPPRVQRAVLRVVEKNPK